MNTQTLEMLSKMKLTGMSRALRTSLETGNSNNLTADELLHFLVTSEWDERYNRKLERTLKQARFRYKASVEQINFENNRLDKNLVLRLAECDFIERNENILIIGSTGIGKSYLASALGYQACAQGFKVMYQHTTKMFARLKMAKADGSYMKEILKIEKQDLLIIDDFGISPLDAQNRSTLMEIIEDRHGKASTIIASQVPIMKWHDIIGEQTIADAILDRLVHDAHRVELKGESLRKKKEFINQQEISIN
jgi:DNA replication protein DnaC